MTQGGRFGGAIEKKESVDFLLAWLAVGQLDCGFGEFSRNN